MDTCKRVVVAAAVMLAAAGIGGCDTGKFFSFGMASSWEVPNDPSTDLAPQVRMGEVAPQPADGRLMTTAAPTGGRVAYVRSTPDAADRDTQHIFIDWDGRSWEILGMPHAGKPLEGLHWDGEFALVVDRWYTPTQGVRVWIDLRKGKGVYAEALAREPETK